MVRREAKRWAERPVIATVLILTVAGSVFADPSVRTSPDVPNFDGAVPVPSNSDFRITADGYLIYQGDTAISCEDVQPDFITPKEAYEEQAGICAEYGFPPGKDLPATGGPPLLLIPLVLLLTDGLLARRIPASERAGPRGPALPNPPEA